jgi:Lrp/AsnC family transcriptional regulator, leucine-responsive regulatory protein
MTQVWVEKRLRRMGNSMNHWPRTFNCREKWLDCPMNQKFELDRKDWQILEVLQANARCSNTEIGKRIGLSQPAVTARIQRLEEAEIIEGYTARLNPKRIGAEITAVIRLRPQHSMLPQCLKAFERMPEIIEVCRMTGEECFLLKAVVGKMAELEAVIDRLLHFGPVTTSIVLASYPPKPVRPRA